MKKLVNTLFFLAIALLSWSQGSFGDIQGRIYMEPGSDQPVMFAKVWVQTGNTKFPSDTDENGRFTIHAVPSGMYSLNVSYDGDTLGHKVIVNVDTDAISRIGRIDFYDKIQEEEGVDIVRYTDPLIKTEFGETRISALDIKRSPAKNDMKALIVSRNSDIQVNDAGQIIIRGSRPGSLVNYIDGVKMSDVQNIPSSAIASVTVYTSGIPAKYGDTTGGVVIMESKGYFDLYREWKIAESAKEF